MNMLRANHLLAEMIKDLLLDYGFQGFKRRGGYIPAVMPLDNEPPPSVRITDWRRELNYPTVSRFQWLRHRCKFQVDCIIQWRVLHLVENGVFVAISSNSPE